MNTLSPTNIVEIISNEGMTVRGHQMFPIEKFCTDFSSEAVARLTSSGGQAGTGPFSNINVPLAASTGATLVNPTDFEQGGATVNTVPVEMNLYSQPMHLTYKEEGDGHKLAHQIQISLDALMDTINDVVAAHLTTGNYGAFVVAKDPATYDANDLKTIWGTTDKFKERHIVMNTQTYANFLPTNKESFVPGDGAYGFTTFNLATKFDAAAANTVGFCADKVSMAFASRLADYSEEVRNLVDLDRVVLDNRMVIQVSKWSSSASRTTWNSLDVVFGAAPGDTGALKLFGSV